MEVVVGKGARICSCRKINSLDKRIAGTRLPKGHAKFNFKTYKPKNHSQVIAREYALNLTDTYPAVERGLLFSGSVGLGKTHLAVSVLKGLIDRGFSGLFYDFTSLLKEIQDSYNPNTHASELSILAPVMSSEVLVLDELGSSKPTEWVLDTMAHIINTRYNNEKLTIFTTNYPDIRPADNKEILEDRIGIRLRSRIYEMCRTVSMIGDDHRKTFDQPLAAKE
jgi:DNA replication protein DnaC